MRRRGRVEEEGGTGRDVGGSGGEAIDQISALAVVRFCHE